MDAADLLELADELSAGAREVDWRGAASRAYYAAFHGARRYLGRLGFAVPRGEQAHAYLWLRLANCGHPDLMVAGRRLNDLRSVRNWADYDLDRPFPHAAGADQVLAALTIRETLAAADSIPALHLTLTRSIQEYESTVLRQPTWQAPH